MWVSFWNSREIQEVTMAENNAWSRSQQSGSGWPRVAEESGNTSDGRAPPTGGRGSLPPREVREQYQALSTRALGTNSQAEERPELRVEERIFVGDQLNSAELQPLVCLLEAQGQGLLRSAREGDELRTGTNMRGLCQLSPAEGRRPYNE